MDSGAVRRKILVLGATGFLGEHVVRELTAAEYDVHAAVRPGSNCFAGSAVAVSEGNLCDATFLRSLLNGIHGVVFSAGRTFQPGLPLEEYHRQNVGLTEAFFDALGRNPHIRVVFTSSLATLTGSLGPHQFAEGDNRRHICEERLSAYSKAKIACEEIALKSARRGNHVVILNPGLMLGPGARTNSKVGSASALLWYFQGKAPIYIRSGMTYTDVRDAARAHVAALEQGRSGERYILGGHCLERRAFYQAAARVGGVKPPHGVPAWVASGFLTVVDAVLAFVTCGRRRGSIHPSFASAEGLYYFASSEKAIRELGYTITPLEATLIDSLRWYHAAGLLPRRFDFVKNLTPENADLLGLLNRLAEQSPYRRFLLPRLDVVQAICRSNQQLNQTLTRLAAAELRNREATELASAAQQADDVRLLNRFFEHLYFASDEFLQDAV